MLLRLVVLGNLGQVGTGPGASLVKTPVKNSFNASAIPRLSVINLSSTFKGPTEDRDLVFDLT